MPSLISQINDDKKKITVCGAGLVGCLAACYFAERNYDVTLFEYRSDIRKMKVVVGRSINMAMSVRGREGLKRINAEEAITSKGIEMYTRMLHDTHGNMTSVPYGKGSQCILSIDRRYLNELLLNEAEKYPNLTIEFNHKVKKCNTNTGEVIFEKYFINSSENSYKFCLISTLTGQEVKINSDLVLGCDGAYSIVRQSLLKDKPVNFSQSYNSGYYLELRIPPINGTFALPAKHLHIWPRGNFMLIALPNQDFSFTCTLFMPLEMFDQLKTSDQVIEFFQKYFVDAMNLMGKENLVEMYFSTKPSSLISITCDPHHGKKCVLFGDSAHAMVPFYGQGMNCAFEDVVVFFEILDSMGFDNIDKVLEKYSQTRVPDAHAICELAIRNYDEMKYLVTTKGYKLRKKLDNFLNALFPSYWVPLYTMVTFSRIRYSEVIAARKKQDKIIKTVAWTSCFSVLTLFGFYAFKNRSIFSFLNNFFKFLRE